MNRVRLPMQNPKGLAIVAPTSSRTEAYIALVVQSQREGINNTAYIVGYEPLSEPSIQIQDYITRAQHQFIGALDEPIKIKPRALSFMRSGITDRANVKDWAERFASEKEDFADNVTALYSRAYDAVTKNSEFLSITAGGEFGGAVQKENQFVSIKNNPDGLEVMENKDTIPASIQLIMLAYYACRMSLILDLPQGFSSDSFDTYMRFEI